jgi:ketosteroid isomerase-like protein
MVRDVGGCFSSRAASRFPTLPADGDTVALEWRVHARTPDGADYRNAYCGVFVIRDGRIAAVREYLDTQYAAQTLLAAR